MQEKSGSDTDESGAVPVAHGAQAKDAARPFLSPRNLTEEEAASPAGVRWLQHDAERLDKECAVLSNNLQEIQRTHEATLEKFNDKRIELEVLRGKFATSIRNEILSYVCLSVGSLAVGASPSYLSVPGAEHFAIIVLIAGGILWLGGIVLRVWK